MSNIEWEPLNNKISEKEDLSSIINYAKGFFGTNNLLLISEYYNFSIYKQFNFKTINLDKQTLDNHYGTKYSFRHNGTVILHTYDKLLGGIFWRKF